MYRLSEVLAIVWVLAWVVCLIKAFSGDRGGTCPSRAATPSGWRR